MHARGPSYLLLLLSLAACDRPEEEVGSSAAMTVVGGPVLVTDEKVGELVEVASNLGLADVTGLAFREDASESFLYALEAGARRIKRFRVTGFALGYEDQIALPAGLHSPRGLAYAREAGDDVVYFLDHRSTAPTISKIYRLNLTTGGHTVLSIASSTYGLQGAQVFGVAKQGAHLLVSYDANVESNADLRVRSGILRMQIEPLLSNPVPIPPGGVAPAPPSFSSPTGIRHMPAANRPIDSDTVDPSLGLATMAVDGVSYLWGSAGRGDLYVADAGTGRGIFSFKTPFGTAGAFMSMTVGKEYLWVAGNTNAGSSFIHRINILRNTAEGVAGPKQFRRMRATLTTDRQASNSSTAEIYHTFGWPYPNGKAPNQGVFPTTHDADADGSGTAAIDVSTYDPANDPDARQKFTRVTYQVPPGSSGAPWSSDFEIEYFTSAYRKFVYPHLASEGGLAAGTTYTADDDVLYGIEDNELKYERFTERVDDWVDSEWGGRTDSDHPYWAARNVMEYTLENYHYPDEDNGYYTPRNPSIGAFESNPGSHLAGLSGGTDWSNNVIACSGTSMLQGGAMRFMGLPSRWVGTSREESAYEDGADDDPFLERGERATVQNGHRFTEVWMGPHHGWVSFDGTPLLPPDFRYDEKPLKVTQWQVMQLVGRIGDFRVIHNIGSELWEDLHTPYISETECEDDSRCGNMRYNLMGGSTQQTKFRRASIYMATENVLFIDNLVEAHNANGSFIIDWSLGGPWDRDPDATVDVVLETYVDGAWRLSKNLLDDPLPASTTALAADVDGVPIGAYRIRVSKTGDYRTGNVTEVIWLPTIP